MGKPETNTQKYFDEILRSILAPKAYSGGIVGNTAALEDITYEVPHGMSEEQAMMVTLGAMLDEDVLLHTASASSAGHVRRMDWLQNFFIRDYLTGDEDRGVMYGEAMAQGRKNAKEALAAFSNGEHTKVNEMLSRAGTVINRIYAEAEIRDDRLWHIVAASMRLMREALGNPEMDRLMSHQVAMDEEKSVFEDENEQSIQYQEQLKKPNLTQPERQQLTLDAMVHAQIVKDYNDYIHSGDDLVRDLFPEAGKPQEGFAISKSEDYIQVFKKYTDKYLQTHPSTLVKQMKTPEGRAEVYRQYAGKIKTLPSYQTVLDSGEITPQILDAKIQLNDHLSEKQRKQLDSEWKKAMPQGTKELQAAYKKALNFDQELSERLSKIAEQYGLKNMTVLTGSLIKERSNGLGNAVMDQKELYLIGDDFDKIYRVYSANGKDFSVKQVAELPSQPGSGTFSKMHMQINETLPLLKQSIALANRLEQLPKDGVFADLSSNFAKLTDSMKSGLGNYSDKVKEQIAQQAKALAEQASSINAADEAQKAIIESIQKFGDDVLAGQIRADERTAQYNIEKSESIARSKNMVGKDRSAEIQKRIAITQKRKEMENKAMGKGAGNRNTEVKNGLKIYLDAVNAKIQNDQELGEKFSNFISALDSLNAMTDVLYTRDENGKYPPFRKEDQGKLLSGYNTALTELGKLKTALGENEQLRELMDLGNHIQQILEKDVTSLTGITADNKLSLAEMIDKGRTLRVDASGKEFSTVGAKSNVRSAMTVVKGGKEVKGFFTKEKIYSIGKAERDKVRELTVDLRVAFPDIAPLFDTAIDRAFDNETFDSLCIIFNTMQNMISENPSLIPAEKAEEIEEALHSLARTDYSAMENEKLRECERFLDTLSLIHQQYHNHIQATQGTSISGRNVAMSKVANLMQVSDIIANSEMMELSDENGNITKGVFMANAKGIDRSKIMPADVEKCTEKSGDNPSLLKDIAELQMLDFICGNIDRHQNNYFYQFNEDRTQLIGIQGIDNDLSFGTKVVPDVAEFVDGSAVLLSAITVVSEKMGHQILAMDESMLKLSLRETGLSEAEMQAAADRLTRVKEKINEKKIEIVPDDKWKDLTLNDLATATEHKSLFTAVYGQVKILSVIAANNLKTKQKAAEEAAQNPEKKAFKFEKVDALDGINTASMQKDADISAGFAAKMAASQKKIWGKGSPEFRNLAAAVKEYSEFVKNLGSNPSSPNYLKVQAKLESIGELAQTYLNAKEGKSLNKNGEERLKLVQDIKAFADKRLPEYKEALHRKDEIEVEEMNAKFKAEAAKKLENSYRDKAINFGSAIPKDGSRVAEFGEEVVLYSYDKLAELAAKPSLTGADQVDAQKHMAHIVAYDLLMSERTVLKAQGKSGPGPLEQKYEKESISSLSYATSLQESIKKNPVFQEAANNLNPRALRQFITDGAHRITQKMVNESKQKQNVPKEDSLQNDMQMQKNGMIK